MAPSYRAHLRLYHFPLSMRCSYSVCFVRRLTRDRVRRPTPALDPKRACLGATHTNAFMSLNFRSWHKGTGTGPRQESGEQQECYPDINRNIGNIKDPNEPDLRRVE